MRFQKFLNKNNWKLHFFLHIHMEHWVKYISIVYFLSALYSSTFTQIHFQCPFELADSSSGAVGQYHWRKWLAICSSSSVLFIWRAIKWKQVVMLGFRQGWVVLFTTSLGMVTSPLGGAPFVDIGLAAAGAVRPGDWGGAAEGGLLPWGGPPRPLLLSPDSIKNWNTSR